MGQQRPAERVYRERARFLFKNSTDDMLLFYSSGVVHLFPTLYPAAFRPDSSYYYLTGNRDPGMVLVLVWVKGVLKRYVIVKQQSFLEKRWESSFSWSDPNQDLSSYDGYFLSTDLNQIDLFLSQYSAIPVWSLCGEVTSDFRKILPAQLDLTIAGELVAKRRIVKDLYEQFLLREAAQRSAKAHADLAQQRMTLEPHETIWHAAWIAAGAKQNVHRQAYAPIIAGGHRACCLHYHGEPSALKTDRYVLIDAAFEYSGYTADITRVYFWKARSWDRIVYEGLLEIQKKLITLVRVGTSLTELQEQTRYLIAQKIYEWEWEEGSIEKIFEQDVSKYYPHRVGHPLGIDVHDLCQYRELINAPLEDGMVITIEPGLYVDPAIFPSTHPAYGLGFRIEDDILITQSGPDNLTVLAPKEWKSIGV